MMPYAEVLAAPLVKMVGDVLNRVLPPEKMSEKDRAAIELALLQQDWAGVAAQLNINLEEAKHESIFVAGWRPFVGWVCGCGFAWAAVVQPALVFCVSVYRGEPPALPELDTALITSTLFGMLGLGGLRTFEKIKGVNKKR